MPSLCASAVVIDSGRVLLMQRKDLGLWSLPGGHVDAEETVAQAAVREVAEETGLTAALTRLVGVYSAPQWRDGGDHTVVFAGGQDRGRAETAEVRGQGGGFYDPDALPEPLLWWHEQRILDAVAGCGGSDARLQGVLWPFAPTWSRRDVEGFFTRSGLSKEGFYSRYWTERGRGDGTIEVKEVRSGA